MSSRKRPFREANTTPAEQSKEQSLIHQLRNSFYFANLYQWIYIFGKVIKIDDSLGIDDLETECLKDGSTALQDIGLLMLKHLSSHRGLTHELFDEYTRRQFSAKMPQKRNPFGDGKVPARFADFDLLKKFRTLWQMTQLIMMKPESIRTSMDEQRVDDQASWRIEPYGWDRKDREYYVLDDNRIYRLTAAQTSSSQPKKNSQKAIAAARAAKRRRLAMDAMSNGGEDMASVSEANGQHNQSRDEDPLGGAKWECVAVTLEDVHAFLEPLKKSKDPNEKVLRQQIEEHLIPLLNKQEESRKRKRIQKERELLSLEKMANAKRSSRLAGKAEQRKHEELEREERVKRLAVEASSRKEEVVKMRMEEDRNNRMISREQRLREREARRLQHEEELAQLSEGSKDCKVERLSQRRLKAQIERNKQLLKDLEEEDEDWTFDCICGLHGQVDDGKHSVACERCNVWQHSKCLDIGEEEADREDFYFVCNHCQQAEQDRRGKQGRRPLKIKLKVKEPASTSSTPAAKAISTTPIPLPRVPGMNPGLFVHVRSKSESRTNTSPLNGISMPSTSASSVLNRSDPSPQKYSSPVDAGDCSFTTAQTLVHNGVSHNPFASPHPNLLPPDQSPNKSRAYGSIYNSTSPAAQDEPEMMNSVPNGLAASQPIAKDTCHGLNSLLREEIKSMSTGCPQKPPRTSMSSASNPKVVDQPRSSPPSIATPRLKPTRPEDSEPLPPSRGGISPTKNSPSLPRSGSISFAEGQISMQSSPAPAVLPPVAALCPSSPQIDSMSPIKHDGEPARPVSLHGPLPLNSSPMP